MEDKRTLIAFLLIGGILLLLPYYYEFMGLSAATDSGKDQAVEAEDGRGNSGRGQVQGVAEDEGRRALSGDVAVEAGRELAGVAGAVGESEFQAREIVVRTPLQILKFSTRGGVLISSALEKYRRLDGSSVELIPEGGRGLVLREVGPGVDVDFGKTEFVADRNRIVVGSGEEASLRLRADLGSGGFIEKTLRFSGDRYGFRVEIRYAGLEEDADLFVRWEEGVALTEGDPSVDLREARVLALFGGSVSKVQVSGDDSAESWEERGDVAWAAARSKYFLGAVMPEGGAERVKVRLYGVGRGKGALPRYAFAVGRRCGGSGGWSLVVYSGPLNYDDLTEFGVELERSIDFGWPVVREISKILLLVFKAMHTVIPNYGLIIVIFGVAIKVLVYPLTHKSYESTAKMQALQPKIAALREKYAKDQQRLSKETMRLYKEEGVNPLGGCLPMVLQMPIFFALYNLFGRTIELRQAGFGLWIRDLSVPDALMVGGVEVHVLPLLMAGSMLVQQKMTMKDPKQAMLVYLMPAMMIFVFWRMSSGLVLYWTVFNMLTILQQTLVSRFKSEEA